MTGLIHETREDFLAKVLPIATDLVEETSFTVRSGSPVTHALNLATGRARAAKNKADRAFQEALLREIYRRHPGAAYPSLCPPPAPAVLAEKLH